MTYQEFIQNILDTRGRFNCGDEYHERHHIIPKCMGGGNEEENLIDLFAREHYEAHKLLAIENPSVRGLQYAWWCMSVITSKDSTKKYQITAEEYETARKMFVSMPYSEERRRRISESGRGRKHSEETREKMSKNAKERYKNPENCSMYGKRHSEETKQKMRENHADMSGTNNPNYGRPRSEETRRKIGEGQKNKPPISEVTRQKMRENNQGAGNPNYGKHPSAESRKRMSEAQKGHPVSEETRQKISEKNKGRLVGEKSPTAKAVIQFDLEGNIICVWGSLGQAEKEVGVQRSGIRSCCHGKLKQSGGFKWQYKDEYEKELSNITTIHND